MACVASVLKIISTNYVDGKPKYMQVSIFKSVSILKTLIFFNLLGTPNLYVKNIKTSYMFKKEIINNMTHTLYKRY